MTDADDGDRLADALSEIARAIHRLGTGDAYPPMGGLEALAVKIEDSAKIVAASISELAAAIRERDLRDDP